MGAHLKAGEFVRLHGGGVGGAHDAGAKARKRGKYVAVALGRAKRHTLDGDGVGADGAGAQPKGSVGPVTLDGHAAGRAIRPLLTRKFVTSGWPSRAGIRSTLTSTPKAFMAWIVRLM